jgi:hypothetical protein
MTDPLYREARAPLGFLRALVVGVEVQIAG